MLFPAEPNRVTSYLLCYAVLFSIDFLVVDIGLSGLGVRFLSHKHERVYHRNVPRGLVILSWKLSSGCVFTFLFLLPSVGALPWLSVAFRGLVDVLHRSRKMQLL